MKKPRMDRNQLRMFNTMMFLLRLIALSTPIYIIIAFNTGLDPLQDTITSQVHYLLNSMGYPTEASGQILTIGTDTPFLVYIGPDCTGWKSFIAYFALVFATLGVSMRKRLFGLVFGTPIIYIGNIVRILLVICIQKSYGLEVALLFHDLLWQAGLIALVLALWLVWLNRERLTEKKPFHGKILQKIKKTLR